MDYEDISSEILRIFGIDTDKQLIRSATILIVAGAIPLITLEYYPDNNTINLPKTQTFEAKKIENIPIK